ncbi:hypothetical protein MBANPS3_011114 [Mucor bainieri]
MGHILHKMNKHFREFLETGVCTFFTFRGSLTSAIIMQEKQREIYKATLLTTDYMAKTHGTKRQRPEHMQPAGIDVFLAQESEAQGEYLDQPSTSTSTPHSQTKVVRSTWYFEKLDCK